MNNSGVIQTSKSDDLITFKVLTEGEELSKIYEVKSIAVMKEVNRIPTAKIVLIDGEASKREFALSNEELLIPGKEIEITAGYHSDEETIFKGIIIKHNVKIRANSSQLIIECKDEAVKMTVGRKSKYFYESKDSEIAEELIGNYGLSNDVEASSHTHLGIGTIQCFGLGLYGLEGASQWKTLLRRRWQGDHSKTRYKSIGN